MQYHKQSKSQRNLGAAPAEFTLQGLEENAETIHQSFNDSNDKKNGYNHNIAIVNPLLFIFQFLNRLSLIKKPKQFNYISISFLLKERILTNC